MYRNHHHADHHADHHHHNDHDCGFGPNRAPDPGRPPFERPGHHCPPGGANRREQLHHTLMYLDRLHYQCLHMELDKIGLYPGQPQLLMGLMHHDGLSQRELAQRAHVRPATMTVMLQRMESAGLVERRADAQDMRVQRVYLNEAGRKAARAMRETMQRLSEGLFAGFDEAEEQQLLAMLERVGENTRRLMPETGRHQHSRQEDDLCENFSDT